MSANTGPSSLGQDAEYEITESILSHFDCPIVIDVGVEHGSFTDLALESGAAGVYAFEALPRHYHALSAKYDHEPKVQLHNWAISHTSGVAQFHIATDPDGNELDYHHSLSDMGDSETVVRTKKSIEVVTKSLGDLLNDQKIPEFVDFLKIDTDGHDMAVLMGLGRLRPRIILAEYWEDLPQSSGANIYSLRDLIEWGIDHGYRRSVVVRRNGAIELVELDASWTARGDWGNVFLFREEEDYGKTKVNIGSISQRRYETALDLQRDLEAKEEVIQQMHTSAAKQNEQLAELKQYRDLFNALPPGIRWLTRANRRAVTILRPRLGNLNQYAARPMTQVKALSAPAAAAPRISIVTPSYGQGSYIERTLLSVLDQKYPDLEYVVQDGGSRDETVQVLEAYSDRLASWQSLSDNGQSDAINKGFSRTSGDIMAWLNSDDLLLPGSLARVEKAFRENPDIDVIYGNRLLIDENDREIGRWIIPGHDAKVLSWADYIPQETLFWRRSIWEKCGSRIDDTFRFAMDWDLLVRFRDAGAKFLHIPEFMGAFRIHEQQKTSAVISEIGFQEMDRIRLRTLGKVPGQREIRWATARFILRHVVSDIAYRVVTLADRKK